MYSSKRFYRRALLFYRSTTKEEVKRDYDLPYITTINDYITHAYASKFICKIRCHIYIEACVPHACAKFSSKERLIFLFSLKTREEKRARA